MAIPIGPPKPLLDALDRAGIVRTEDLKDITRVAIDMPAGDLCKITVEQVGGNSLTLAMADFIDRLTSGTPQPEDKE